MAEKQFKETILLALETISGCSLIALLLVLFQQEKICLAAIFNNPILDKVFQKNKTLKIFSGKIMLIL